ncbi:condensation domain-containing protein, partial [Thiomonas sp. FB-6]|uniref:condensation domain-containing protein n=1 Tax=Thiomonas sp. FB-6 TaxID=1158291 RepID=UPI0005709766
HPTIAGLAEVLEGNWPQWSTEAMTAVDRGGPLAEAIKAVDAGDLDVVSFPQRALWFLDQLEGGSRNYVIDSVTRIVGELDLDQLEASVQALVVRHPALRSAFIPGEDGPRLRVMDPSLAQTVKLRRERVVPGVDLQQRLLARLNQPFDLQSAPLLRASVLEVTAEDHVFVLSIHHIVSDGWSMAILFRELAMLYAGARLGEAPPLTALHALLQARAQSSGAFDADEAYWREQLAGLPRLDVPTDHPRPAQPGADGLSVGFRIEADVAEALRAMAHAHSTTLFTALLAAFQLLLAHHSGQDDVAVGVPVADRVDPALADTVGYLVNTVVMRTRLDGAIRFGELLERVRDTTLEAINHSRMPFDRVVAALQPERETGRHPLVDVIFAFDDFPQQSVELDGLRCSPWSIRGDTAKFDLSMALHPEGRGLEGYLEFRTDLYDEAMVERMARRFDVLLRSVVASPETPIGELA